MKNNSDRIIIEFIKDKEIFKSIKNSIGERLKVRETVYYRVRNQDGNTNSPSPKSFQQIGYKLLSALNFKGKKGEEVAKTLISACLWNDSVESKSERMTYPHRP